MGDTWNFLVHVTPLSPTHNKPYTKSCNIALFLKKILKYSHLQGENFAKMFLKWYQILQYSKFKSNFLLINIIFKMSMNKKIKKCTLKGAME